MAFADERPPLRPWKIVGSVVAVSAIFGVVCGLLWAFLAPTEQFVVVEPGVGAALTGESLHRFDSLALLVCCALVGGVVLPVTLWAWTGVRGPVLYMGLFVGAGVGSAAMLGVGVLVAGLVHPRPDDPASGTVVALAPGMESLLVLLVQPLVASLVVLLLAAMNPHDNLRFTPVTDHEADTDLGVQSNGPERA
ncbi:DUF2567 domain-containing protein [Rhodococcus sp. G-MC3]|uniref:DUF2567 domain-containing protein n=1 Tax=Rhodococcus sp. G-MC3 TaxID=3046209 RepID=UPI0024BB82D8|nr:DUF2567 domain-containing protein [Rhodococcus sp. G-MC3]MDJ0393126.1 DUF2567 domain-containing protein [Rhodococcus sp. G-MC3]